MEVVGQAAATGDGVRASLDLLVPVSASGRLRRPVRRWAASRASSARRKSVVLYATTDGQPFLVVKA
jgi:hypothetical protein